jgi:hypothetical protein
MAGIIGADNQFGKDFGHPSASLQGTILAIYEVSISIRFWLPSRPKFRARGFNTRYEHVNLHFDRLVPALVLWLLSLSGMH